MIEEPISNIIFNCQVTSWEETQTVQSMHDLFRIKNISPLYSVAIYVYSVITVKGKRNSGKIFVLNL